MVENTKSEAQRVALITIGLLAMTYGNLVIFNSGDFQVFHWKNTATFTYSPPVIAIVGAMALYLFSFICLISVGTKYEKTLVKGWLVAPLIYVFSGVLFFQTIFHKSSTRTRLIGGKTDGYVLQTEGAERLANGENPYTYDYSSEILSQVPGYFRTPLTSGTARINVTNPSNIVTHLDYPATSAIWYLPAEVLGIPGTVQDVIAISILAAIVILAAPKGVRLWMPVFFLVDWNLILFPASFIPDAGWIFFTVLALLFFHYPRVSAIMFAFGASYRPQPILIASYVGIIALKHYGWEYIKKWVAAGLLATAAINLPFTIWTGPVKYIKYITIPIRVSIPPGGVGPAGFMRYVIQPASPSEYKWLFTLAVLIVWLGTLAITWRRYEDMGVGLLAFPGLVLWFHWRSLQNYLLWFPFIVMAAYAFGIPERNPVAQASGHASLEMASKAARWYGSRRRIIKVRVAAGLLIALLVLPAIASGLSHTPTSSTGQVSGAQDVTFVSTQGNIGSLGGQSRVVALNMTSKDIIWSHSEYNRYYDVDPIGENRLLFAAHIPGEGMHAVVVNWRTDTVQKKFKVPSDTHDVDKIGSGRYAIADKMNHRAYVYEPSTDQVIWEYNFKARHRADAGGGIDGNYTHLNDIDSVDGGEKFLVSPRNFDRVMLLSRDTKNSVLTLGAEDKHSVLYEQHNPALLSKDPPVVLVADSENHRIVEYEKVDGAWRKIWTYGGRLSWPRDADRLPNGNTLIVDTRGQRVIEVSPDGEVVWEAVVPKMPYDVERLEYGDEPTGPAMSQVRSGSDGISSDSPEKSNPLRHYYTLSLWVLPVWVGFIDFAGLALAGVITTCLLSVEAFLRIRKVASWAHEKLRGGDKAVADSGG